MHWRTCVRISVNGLCLGVKPKVGKEPWNTKILRGRKREGERERERKKEGEGERDNEGIDYSREWMCGFLEIYTVHLSHLLVPFIGLFFLRNGICVCWTILTYMARMACMSCRSVPCRWRQSRSRRRGWSRRERRPGRGRTTPDISKGWKLRNRLMSIQLHAWLFILCSSL